MKVRLHNNAKDSAEATDNTIKMLPGGCKLKRDKNNEIEFDENGLATVEGGDLGFIQFALVRQGYVKEIVED